VGPFGVVQLGSNPWVNGIYSNRVFDFALSLLGAFEITLPSSVLTEARFPHRAARLLSGTMLMGLTFALTSFACGRTVCGSVLAASVTSKGAQPVLGMASFATGLALPFFFLAAFLRISKTAEKRRLAARVKTVMDRSFSRRCSVCEQYRSGSCNSTG